MSIFGVIEEWSARPFSYGQDCCQFVGAVVEEATGKNPMRGLDYSNEQEARELIASFGSLHNAICHQLGLPIPVAEAEDGDVLLVDLRQHLPHVADHLGFDQMAGVFWNGVCVVKTQESVTDWPLSRCSAAWRTG